MKEPCVYQILNTVNGESYIGSTAFPATRKREHLNSLKGNRHQNKRLQQAWNVYGEDAFRFQVLETVDTFDRDQLVAREQYYLDVLKPEYNLSPNAANKGRTLPETVKQKISATKKEAGIVTLGFTGRNHSKETRQKMSESRTGSGNNMYGKTHSEEARKKISKAHKGKKLSEDHKAAFSLTWKGKKFSEEHKRKISEALKGRVFSEEHKKNISEAKALQNKGENNPMFGKKHSEETKAKMRKAKRKTLVGFRLDQVERME
jgi:group I intron endonuclease